jgi:hypothetical protein
MALLAILCVTRYASNAFLVTMFTGHTTVNSSFLVPLRNLAQLPVTYGVSSFFTISQNTAAHMGLTREVTVTLRNAL